jgi:hypothetical protein
VRVGWWIRNACVGEWVRASGWVDLGCVRMGFQYTQDTVNEKNAGDNKTWTGHELGYVVEYSKTRQLASVLMFAT